MSVSTELFLDGPVTEVTFTTEDGWPVTVEALCDTGASSSSIDEKLADMIGVEYTGTVVRVRNANGVSKRRRCIIEFECAVGVIEAPFTVSNRSGLPQPVILGRDVIFEEEEEEEEEWY